MAGSEAFLAAGAGVRAAIPSTPGAQARSAHAAEPLRRTRPTEPRHLGGAALAAALSAAAVTARRTRLSTPSSRRASRLSAVAAAPAVAGAPVETPTSSEGRIDPVAIRKEFPCLQQEARPGVPLIYLDNAATSQKPARVIRELKRFYSEDNSNVHRGMHTLSIRSTEAFEAARAKVAKFIGADDVHEVIFTRNATEAINVVAKTWGRVNILEGDEIITTVMEHHSNMVPWQMLAEENGATVKYCRLTSDGMLDRDHFESLLSERTKLVAMSHVSNVLGCVNPISWVAEKAHAVGAKVLADACQSIPHMPVDVQKLGSDWLVASSHKMCGPTGMGFLWGKAELLQGAPPFLGGGEMIDIVTLEGSTYATIPHRLEAGTPAFAEAHALGVACDYLMELGMENVTQAEHELSRYMWRRMSELPGIIMYGPSPEVCPERASLVSFNVEGCHANDIVTLVDQDRGIAMRAGHQCCQPLHAHYGVPASARMSAYFYNTTEEIDIAIDALKDAIGLLTGSADDLDLFSLDGLTNRWGVDIGPPTAMEALRERGLVEKTTWSSDADCPLAEAGVSVSACVAFDPTQESLRLEDLPGLVFLRLCQLYSQSPVCLTASGAARSGAALGLGVPAVSPAQLDANTERLHSCFRAALDFSGDTPAATVDDAAWLEEVSASELMRDLSSDACSRLTAGEGLLAVPQLCAWGFARARNWRSSEIFVQAGSAEQFPAMVAGLELAQPEESSGCIALAPLPAAASLGAGPVGGDASAFHKRLLGASDEEVPALLRHLTTVPMAEVDELVASMADQPGAAQRRLADEVARLVFGECALDE